jgi:hypothetical protein
MAPEEAVKYWPAGESVGTLKKAARKLSKIQDGPTIDPCSSLQNDTFTNIEILILLAILSLPYSGKNRNLKIM